MPNKYVVDYWIEVWRFANGKIKFMVHLDDTWQPASFDDCTVVLVTNDRWTVGMKVYGLDAQEAIKTIKLFASQHMTSGWRINQFTEYGGWKCTQ